MFEEFYKMNSMKYTNDSPQKSAFPDDTVVAMAYIPYQQEDETYSPEQGICSGTMFPVLNKPFTGCGGNKNE